MVIGLLQACSSGSDNASQFSELPTPPSQPPETQFQATVTRTDFGIPHVRADDWPGLGYGLGYAYAEDNYCLLMRSIIVASGQSSLYLGEAGNQDNDFLWALINGDEAQLQQEWFDPQPQHVKDLIGGYVAGFNRYFRDTGRAALASGEEGCRDAEWTREINHLDLLRHLRKLTLQGSTDNGTIRQILNDVEAPTASSPTGSMARQSPDLSLPPLFSNLPAAAAGGSNAIAVGRDYSQSGSGLLLGNPHQPWQGTGQFYMMHLTIEGEYDAMGASLHGIPAVNIGFNKDVAWSHTVSFANRLTLYELLLNPDNPMQYFYDGELRDIESETVSIDTLDDSGNPVSLSKTFYRSHYGLLVDLRSQNPAIAGWPIALSGTVFAMRDANIDNIQGIAQWITAGQADSVTGFADALREVAFPWVHTVAADRNGEVFYGDISSIPHVDQGKLDDCVSGPLAPLITAVTSSLIIALDGSRSACEWGRDPDSPEGRDVFGFDALPKIFRTDYVANSNNSYWLSHADEPLNGFPIIMGPLGGEQEQQFLRTRITHQMVAERIAGTDGLDAEAGFSHDNLKALMYSNRVLGAELALDDVLSACPFTGAPLDGGQRTAVEEACTLLTNWDRRVNADSIGAQVFTEFWRALKADFDSATPLEIENQVLWSIDFDPGQAIATPSGFDLASSDNANRIAIALATAVARLEANNVAPDLPFGDAQFVERNGTRIPIHGGLDDMGVFGVIKVGLEDGGYRRVTGGNSYIQAVTWDAGDCPLADAVLVPSQSNNPESAHYSDQTSVYSEKAWVRLPFCSEAINEQQIGSLELQE